MKSIKQYYPRAVISRPGQNPGLTTRCPTTGQLSQATEWMKVSTPEGDIIWWRCQKCNNWHILAANGSK
ncbi:MAG: hypothetical protein JXM69_09290 [Anaerolineae bacterium]|nr:hypothetical protein [Anaerolineae bacterium]